MRRRSGDDEGSEADKAKVTTEVLEEGRQPEADEVEALRREESGVDLSSELGEEDGDMMSEGTQFEDGPHGGQGSSSSGSRASTVTMSSADLAAMIENSQNNIGSMLLGEHILALDTKFKKLEASQAKNLGSKFKTLKQELQTDIDD